MKATYRVVREDRHHNLEVLAVAADRDTIDYALRYDNLDPKKVRWSDTPIERSDPRGGGWLVYEGRYQE